MNLKYKVHVDNQKQATESDLAARIVILKEKGLDDKAIGRNPTIRKLKAALRTSVRRLGRIQEIEAATVNLATAKADKRAAEKKALETAKQKPKDIVAKKSQKEMAS